MVADLLRYADVWETIAISTQGFANYLETHRQNLDPIEGVWDGTGTLPHRIGIIRDNSKPGRDFVGFILNTTDPTWHEGYKKIDIKRGVQPGSYVLDYYLEDFSESGNHRHSGAKPDVHVEHADLRRGGRHHHLFQDRQ